MQKIILPASAQHVNWLLSEPSTYYCWRQLLQCS